MKAKNLGKVFTIDQIFELKEVAYSNFNKRKVVDRETITLEEDIYTGLADVIIDNKMGRAQMHIEKKFFSDELTSYLNKLGKKYNPNCEFMSLTFCRYAREYGYPQLMPHIDHPSKIVYVLDLQLDSNKSWPICFEEESYILENEESILIEPTKYPHWREPVLFKNEEYVDMMFIYYWDDSLEKNSDEEDPEIMYPIRKAYHKKRVNAGVPDIYSNYNPALEEKKAKNGNV
jgi:hypothetical protein